MKCCDYNSGMMRTKISIERAVKTSDGAGGYIETWSPIRGTAKRGHVKTFSGNQTYANSRTEGRSSISLMIRYTNNIFQTDRILMRNIRYEITSINNIEFQDKWLEINLSGGVPT